MTNHLYRRRIARLYHDLSVMFGRRSPPCNIIWFLTERCNCKCPHCFVFNESRVLRQEMPSADVLTVLESARNVLRGIVFTGGEPFLYKGLEPVILYASTMPRISQIVLSTNGLMYQALMKLLAKIQNPALQVTIQSSLDGPESVHNRIRGNPNAFASVMNMISGIKQLQQQQRLKVDIQLVMTVSKLNVEYVQDTLNMAVQNHVPIILNFVRSSHDACLPLDQKGDFDPTMRQNLTVDEIKKAIAIWTQTAPGLLDAGAILMHQVRMDNILLFHTHRKWSYRCAAGLDDAVLYPDGSVAICEMRNPIGNLYKSGLDYIKFWKSHKPTGYHTCFCAYDCAILNSMTKSSRGYMSIIKKLLE